MVLLALAVVLAVLDLTRSVAGSALSVTSLDATWAGVSEPSRRSVEASVRASAGDTVWDGLALLLALPGWIVFGLLAAFFLWAGRKRRSAYARFARE